MLVEVQDPAEVAVEAFVVEDERDLVQDLGVDRGHDPLERDVAQLGDLLFQPGRDGPVAPAHDRVGLDAPAAQLGDGVLRRLRLLLSRRADVRHEGDVHVEDVLPADLVAELPDRFEEREDLDVADGAADLGDHHVDVVVGERVDARLDLVGDVRDDLHGLAEVLAPPFLGEHRLVDRTGRGVGPAGQRDVDEALVVPEVEVGLALVVGDEDLTVLERVHRPGVDVDVRVELLHRDPQPPALEEPAQRGGGQSFAEAGCHPTRHEDVLRHRGPFWSRARALRISCDRNQPVMRRYHRRGRVPVILGPAPGRPEPGRHEPGRQARASRRRGSTGRRSTPSSRGRTRSTCSRATSCRSRRTRTRVRRTKSATGNDSSNASVKAAMT